MSWESGKIGLAFALGAIVGLVIALEIGWFWPIGLVLGCATAYFTYEHQVVVSAFSRAYRVSCGWRPKESPRQALTFVGWYLAFSALIVVWLVILKPLVGLLPGKWPPPIESYITFSMALSLVYLLGRLEIEKNTAKFRQICLFLCPPLTVYYLIRGSIWFVPRFLRTSTRFAFWLMRFLRVFFFLVHSENRLLCLFGAAIGFIWGYFVSHEVLSGGVVGGFFGLVYHATIVERWLKPRGWLPTK